MSPENTDQIIVQERGPLEEQTAQKVSDLVVSLKRDIEDKHRFVRVIGEISSFKQWRSGHCYFDIKDEYALLPAVMFRPHVARLAFEVQDGMEVICTGKVSIYAATSRLQMIVENIEPVGHGALALAFEQLKSRLKAEGLFEAHFKKPIPKFTTCVGLVTSSHGAVLRDMVRILKSRMPGLNIMFTPVRVQGLGASKEISEAINLLDSMGACDVIIVGRGGGSLEDLWAFNEEVVARAIFRSKTPIISAVGHETDTTIGDFVADLRAATPTHAANLVVPKLADLMAELDQARYHLKLKHHACIQKAALALMHEKRKLKDPRLLFIRHWQSLDEIEKRLLQLFQRYSKALQADVTRLADVLKQHAPLRQLRIKREAVSILTAKLHKHARARFVYHRQEFLRVTTKLEAMSPLSVLARGYSLIEDRLDGTVLSRVEQYTIDQVVRIKLENGAVYARVIEGEINGTK